MSAFGKELLPCQGLAGQSAQFNWWKFFIGNTRVGCMDKTLWVPKSTSFSLQHFWAKRGPCSCSKITLQLISLSKASSAGIFMPYLMSHRLQPLSCRACSKAMANWWAKTISVLATAFWHPAVVEGGARIGWQVGPPTVKQALTAWPPTAKPMVGSLVLILMLHGLLHTSSPSSKSLTGFWDHQLILKKILEIFFIYYLYF